MAANLDAVECPGHADMEQYPMFPDGADFSLHLALPFSPGECVTPAVPVCHPEMEFQVAASNVCCLDQRSPSISL